MKQTQVRVLNKFAGAIFDLIRSQNQNLIVIAHCLQLLINVTFDSPNTSIYLATRHGFLTILISLIDESALSNDATWLLTHICSDGVGDLNEFQKSVILDLFAKKLTQDAIKLELVCEAADLLIQSETTCLGV